MSTKCTLKFSSSHKKKQLRVVLAEYSKVVNLFIDYFWNSPGKQRSQESKFITMEQKFKSLTIFEFQKKFPNEDACLRYLAKLKWKDGFVCPNCGHTKYCQGKRKHDRQFI